jgi:ribose 5-phosphate isomerase B
MKIFIGTDHAGFELKQKLIPFLEGLGHEVMDKGALEYDAYDDYPDYITLVAKEISKNPDSTKFRGIILGASGQGEAMVANKFKNVRAMVYYCPNQNASIIKTSRNDTDSNIISLGARFITENEAMDAVKDWLETPFPGEERHVRRIAKLNSING